MESCISATKKSKVFGWTPYWKKSLLSNLRIWKMKWSKTTSKYSNKLWEKIIQLKISWRQFDSRLKTHPKERYCWVYERMFMTFFDLAIEWSYFLLTIKITLLAMTHILIYCNDSNFPNVFFVINQSSSEF